MKSSVKLGLTSLILASLLSACGQESNDTASELAGSSGTDGCSAGVAWRRDTIVDPNFAMYNYAASQLGKKVGAGECSDLIVAAEKVAGAKSFDKLGPTGPTADYIWGTRIATFTGAQSRANALIAGDVLQFKNVSTKKVFPNGSWTTSSYPHHTAMVKAVSTDGTQICIYEQNSNNRRFVTLGTVDLTSLTGGTIWAYRAIKQ